MNDRHGRARVALAAVLAFLAITPSARAEPVPTVPIVTAFGYWDHHWFAWLPQHPTYEAVEVAAVEHPRRVVGLVHRARRR